MATSVETFFQNANTGDWNPNPSPHSSFSSANSSFKERSFQLQHQNSFSPQGHTFSAAYQRSLFSSQQNSPYGSGELQPRYDNSMYGQPQGIEPGFAQYHPSNPPPFYPQQQQGASRFAPKSIAPPAFQAFPALPQFPATQAYQQGPRGTSSCRYTSWTGQENNKAVDGLDCIEDEYDSEEEEDLEVAAATLRKLTMPSASNEASGLANPFSWKELEKSCRKLDEAHIRIEEIDLTCCEEDQDNSKVLYNYRLQACPEEEAPQEASSVDKAHYSTLRDARDSPANSSSGFSIGTSSTTASFASTDAKVTPAQTQEQQQDLPLESTPSPAASARALAKSGSNESGSAGQRQDGAVSKAQGSQFALRSAGQGAISQGVGARGMKMSSIMKTVKERCGLLFTSSAKPKRRAAFV